MERRHNYWEVHGGTEGLSTCRGGGRALQGTGNHRRSAQERRSSLRTEHPERTVHLSEKKQTGVLGQTLVHGNKKLYMNQRAEGQRLESESESRVKN